MLGRLSYTADHCVDSLRLACDARIGRTRRTSCLLKIVSQVNTAAFDGIALNTMDNVNLLMVTTRCFGYQRA